MLHNQLLTGRIGSSKIFRNWLRSYSSTKALLAYELTIVNLACNGGDVKKKLIGMSLLRYKLKVANVFLSNHNDIIK